MFLKSLIEQLRKLILPGLLLIKRETFSLYLPIFVNLLWVVLEYT